MIYVLDESKEINLKTDAEIEAEVEAEIAECNKRLEAIRKIGAKE